MYQRILIATDGSELSAKAIENGLSLAKACRAEVIIVTVTEPLHSLGDRRHMFQGVPEPLRQQAIDILFEASKQALADAEAAAQSANVPATVKSLEEQHPYEAIIAAAREHDCDLIVMASHGRQGATRILLGSETTKVLTHTDIPVLVCR